MAAGFLGSHFIVQVLKGDPITVYGDGTQTRSFCYVKGMIDAFMSFMNTEDDVTGQINLGNPSELTILELAKKITDLTGSSINSRLMTTRCDADPISLLLSRHSNGSQLPTFTTA